MSDTRYDAIVIGARCAGSPTAMLLARRGLRVLLVDRASFPSDTVSTHLIHPPGVAALRRWGLLDRLAATGCPAIHTYEFDFGPIRLSGSPGREESPVAYGPRRTVLDALLLEAAAEAGVEVRQEFSVEGLIEEDGRVAGIRGRGRGGEGTERARIVIGADGHHSMVAQAVGAERYRERPKLQVGYYSYWSGLPMDGRFEAYDRMGRAFAVWPTNHDQTLIVMSWPYAEFQQHRDQVEATFQEGLDRAPEFAARVKSAKREERFVGTALDNFFRKPFGPGWALVGDAGYTRDFITAQGISDAFLDAEGCAEAVHAALSGARSEGEAMGGWQAARDARVLPMYEFTCQFAMLAPPPEDLQQLLRAAQGNREAMSDFARVISGVVSPAEFYAPENVARIFAAAGAN